MITILIRFFFSVYEPDSLKYILKEDDLEAFKQYIYDINSKSKFPFDYEQMISINYQCPSFYVENNQNSISLNKFAAFYGSTKIFDFISANLQNLGPKIEKYVIAGGNKHIIQTCVQENISFDFCFEQSIRFHRYDISDWLLINYNCETIDYKYILHSYNFQALLFMAINDYDITKSYTNFFNSCCKSHFSFNIAFCLDILKLDVNTIFKNHMSPLLYSIKSNNFKLFKYLVETKHADINSVDGAKYTPLCLASSLNSPLYVEYLCTRGVNHNIRNKNQMNALHIACQKGYFNVVKCLIEIGKVDKEIPEANGSTPLLLTCKYLNNVRKSNSDERLLVAKYLIKEQKCNVNHKDVEGFTALHYACREGDYQITKCLCKYGADPNISNVTDETPLHSAIKSRYDNMSILFLLIHYHADINAKIGGALFRLPIHIAVERNKIDIVKYLIEKLGVDKNSKDYCGCTPLHYASSNKSLCIMKYLIAEQNVDPNITNNIGATPLHCLASSNQFDKEVLSYLINHPKVNKEAKDENGCTPLHLACKYGLLDTVKYLLYGDNTNLVGPQCDLEALDNFNQTPLFYAVQSGNFEMVKFLIDQANCNFKVVNYLGQSILHIASKYGYVNIISFLIENKSVKVNEKSEEGKTALDYATSSQKKEAIEYLNSYIKKQNQIGVSSKRHINFNPFLDVLAFLCITGIIMGVVSLFFDVSDTFVDIVLYTMIICLVVVYTGLIGIKIFQTITFQKD